jgi:bifunctional UDP-N-acetylglucosamine pyrophosphorylase/glucosamine-1-phosphate N-acetyltransferase
VQLEVLPVVVIAAAGRARRFSGEQKVLAAVGGRPAVCRVADVCEEALGPHRQVVVIGHQGAHVRAVLGEAPGREYVTQEQQLGTGHALAVALAHLEHGPEREVFFVCGDRPLLTAWSLRRIRSDREASGAAMALLAGSIQGDAMQSRQGRVVQAHRNTPQAEVLAIIERSTIDTLDGKALTFESSLGERHEYTREQLLAVRDVNLSAYVWPERVLREHLPKLELHPEKGEYFVTDLVAILREQRLLVRAISASVEGEGIGIDTPDLLRAARQACERLQPAEEPAPRWARADAVDAEVGDALL